MEHNDKRKRKAGKIRKLLQAQRLGTDRAYKNMEMVK